MAVRRRIRLWAAGTALAAGILVVIGWQVSRARCFTLAGSTICRVETELPLVALSFDDGPTQAGVAYVTDVLGRFDAQATFFLIGHEVERRPDLVRRLVAAGHEVGNHGFSHRRMVGGRPEFYDREITRTDAALRRAGAPSPRWFRPPYGKKLVGLPLAVERQSYRMVTWDVEDPPGAADPRDYAERILRDARPGSIILMHVMYPANRNARDALPLVLDGLRARGLEVVTVGRLIDSVEGREN